ncbi:MAG: co-chaperone DjlA [Pseudomonadota bacterium]
MNQVLWGKFAGGVLGFMAGHWLGAIVGVVVGHQFDVGLSRQRAGRAAGGQDVREVQFEFFTASFWMMGHTAKADGRVSEQEIRVAREVMQRMQLNEEQTRSAITLFNEGKQEDFDAPATLRRFHGKCRHHPDLLRTFMEIQIQVALADGDIGEEQWAVLTRAASSLGISRSELSRLEALVRRHGSSQAMQVTPTERLQQSYRLLGVDRDASDSAVKKAYRRLMNQHHPDKLVGRDMPEEMVRLAEERTRQIREAYDTIRSSRS